MVKNGRRFSPCQGHKYEINTSKEEMEGIERDMREVEHDSERTKGRLWEVK